MRNLDETNDPARIVADEANSEQAKARRVLDAGNPLIEAAMALSEIGYDRDVALLEVERLRTENAALRVIAQAVAGEADGYGGACELYLPAQQRTMCVACGESVYGFPQWRPIQHTDECVVTQARALLADTPTTRSDATQRNDD